MFAWFLPKDFNFFELFEKQVGQATEAARCFREMVSTGAINEASLRKINDIEHQADDIAHAIIDQLNKTFITPFDREDIHALTKELDDIVDMINTITNRLVTYKISGTDAHLVRFSIMIKDSIDELEVAIKGLRNMKNAKTIQDACIEVNRLENEGDSARDAVLAELFENGKDPIAIIKWKEIYQDAETVLDICEDVAHIVGSILVKQA
jgi:uncharacterized protein